MVVGDCGCFINNGCFVRVGGFVWGGEESMEAVRLFLEFSRKGSGVWEKGIRLVIEEFLY